MVGALLHYFWELNIVHCIRKISTIVSKVNTILTKYEIQNKVNYVTTDSAPNILNAASEIALKKNFPNTFQKRGN